MAAFELTELFGTNALKQPDEAGVAYLNIRLNDFRGESNDGDLPDSVGSTLPEYLTPVQILYSLILLIKHNQAVNINADPEQQIFITESPKTIVTGARDGQVKRSFVVNFFSDQSLAGTTGVDYI
jgi:hypothetical protein